MATHCTGEQRVIILPAMIARPGPPIETQGFAALSVISTDALFAVREPPSKHAKQVIHSSKAPQHQTSSAVMFVRHPCQKELQSLAAATVIMTGAKLVFFDIRNDPATITALLGTLSRRCLAVRTIATCASVSLVSKVFTAKHVIMIDVWSVLQALRIRRARDALHGRSERLAPP